MRREVEYSTDTFGGRLQQLRLELGLERYELYNLIFSTSEDPDLCINKCQRESRNDTIRRWESGETSPSAFILNKICDIFGCTSDYLLGRSAFIKDLDFTIHKETGLSSEFISSLKRRRQEVYHTAGKDKELLDNDGKKPFFDITDRKCAILETLFQSDRLMNELGKLLMPRENDLIRIIKRGQSDVIAEFKDVDVCINGIPVDEYSFYERILNRIKEECASVDKGPMNIPEPFVDSTEPSLKDKTSEDFDF